MESQKSIFTYVADEFQKAGIAHVLIGGFAVNFYSVSRQTEDVDFMIVTNDFEKARGILEKGGYQLLDVREAFARFSKGSKVDLDIDLMFVESDTFKKVLAEAKSVRLSQRDFLVPSVNHLIGLKLHAIKNNPKNRELKDLPDIVALIKNNNLDYKCESFKSLCLKFGTEDTFQKIIRYLE